MPLTLIDLIHLDGIPNPPGTASMHGFALMSDFTTIQKVDEITDDAATATTAGAISEAHVFAVGKSMKRLYGTENKNEMKEDTVGDTDSQIAKSSVTIMCPGMKAEYHTMKKVLNCTLGILFVQSADGLVMQYGTEAFPCHFKVSWGSGNNEGYRGYTITASCYGDGAIYTPGLNFTPAVAP